MHDPDSGPGGGMSESEGTRADEFARAMLARLARHRRRRRRILAVGVGAALASTGVAFAWLPASADRMAPGAADIVAALVLVTACCLAWLFADAGAVRVSGM